MRGGHKIVADTFICGKNTREPTKQLGKWLEQSFYRRKYTNGQ